LDLNRNRRNNNKTWSNSKEISKEKHNKTKSHLITSSLFAALFRVMVRNMPYGDIAVMVTEMLEVFVRILPTSISHLSHSLSASSALCRNADGGMSVA